MNRTSVKNIIKIKESVVNEKPVRIQSLIDFSDIEDRPDFNIILRDLVSQAGKEAYQEAEAAGVSRVYLKNDKIVSVGSDNTEVIIEGKNKIQGPYFIKYRKGLKFHASKK
jgi:hypothetical protein